MGKCRQMASIERWLDGELPESDAIKRHLSECPQCGAYSERLGVLRRGVQTVAMHEEIRDSQFPAFMEGVRARIDASRRRSTGIWALASVGAAALIVAGSIFVVITGGPSEVGAQTVVLEASTQLEGWRANAYTSENGTATVWVDEAEEDLW